jgi:hypothetical protein
MPTLDDFTSDKLAAARDAGFTDDQIAAHISADDQVKGALDHGFTLDHVAAHFNQQAALDATQKGLAMLALSPAGIIAQAQGNQYVAQKQQVQPASSSAQPITTGASGIQTGAPVVAGTGIDPSESVLPIPYLPENSPEFKAAHPILSGITGAIKGALNIPIGFEHFMTSPEGAAATVGIPAAATIYPILGTAAAVGFGLAGLKGLFDEGRKIGSGDESVQGAVQYLGSNLLMVLGAAAGHAAARGVDPAAVNADMAESLKSVPTESLQATASDPAARKAFGDTNSALVDQELARRASPEGQAADAKAKVDSDLATVLNQSPEQTAAQVQATPLPPETPATEPVKTGLEVGSPITRNGRDWTVKSSDPNSVTLAASDTKGVEVTVPRSKLIQEQGDEASTQRRLDADAALDAGSKEAVSSGFRDLETGETHDTGTNNPHMLAPEASQAWLDQHPNVEPGWFFKDGSFKSNEEILQAKTPAVAPDGVYPAEKVVEGSANPEDSQKISPQALGIRAPLPKFLQDGIDYLTGKPVSEIWKNIKGSIDATLGGTFSKTTRADRASGELGARWISSRIAAPHLAETFSHSVLDEGGVDPKMFGAALTEDNLRSVRKGFLDAAADAAAKGDSKGEAKATDAANKVVSIIGSKGSPFSTEADYRAFLSDPATQAAIAKHKALWENSIDPMYRNAQMLDPTTPLATRGQDTAARINLYNDVDAKGKDVVSGTGAGNLTATLRRKSPFGIRATGSGQSYNINYHDMMANTFGRQLEIANKNAFEQRLVESGNAKIGTGSPQDNLLPDGSKGVAFPLKRTTIITQDGKSVPVNQTLFVKSNLSGEYRRGANVDLTPTPSLLKAFNTLVNRSALAGLTDASVHSLNLLTALFTRPGVVGGALTDSLLSTFGRADIPITITKVLMKSLQDNKSQVAKLSEIGAMRAQHPANWLGGFIQSADKATRLVMDDTFDKLVKNGLVQDTETNRREFVNQVGQYNSRAQGKLRTIFRSTGLGPFVTAGTTFNTLGLRTATLSPGVRAVSPMAAAALRANVFSKWVGGAVAVGTLNYLLTKDKGGGVMGRPGVPVGRIDTGLSDKNNRPLSIPAFAIMGLDRAMRVTGARGFMEAQRKGLTLGDSFDAAARDIANTSISPFAGPAVRFGTVALTGQQPAINVGRTSRVVPPGQSQTAENIKQAILDANPIIKSISLAREPGQGVWASVRQQIPRLSLQPSQAPDFMAHYPEIVHKAQARDYINDMIGHARKLEPEDQRTFVNQAMKKLTPEDQQQALRTLKYSRISY